MFQDYYGDRAPYQLAKEFGPGFATALFKLKPGQWQGPIESGYGWHLIWIESIAPGKVPAFEEVEPDVKTAWLADQKAIQWQKAYATMRAKYDVIAPQPPPASQGTAAGAMKPTCSEAPRGGGRSAALLLGVALAPALPAHEIRPAYLQIDETQPNDYAIVWRTPVSAGMRLPILLQLPKAAGISRRRRRRN